MSAQKARWIRSVDRDARMVHFANGESCHFVNLPKSELIRTLSYLAIRFPESPMKYDLAALRAALETGIAPSFLASDSPTRGNRAPAPVVRVNPAPVVVQPAPVVVQPSEPVATASALERLAAIVQSLADRIGRIADAVKRQDDAIASLTTEVTNLRSQRPIQVTLAGTVTGTVKGLTHSVFPEVLRSIAGGNAAWLVGPAGTGKSTIASQVAEALGLEFHAESMSAATTEYKFLGFRDANGNYEPTAFRRLFETGGVFCLDEVDSANPNVLTVLNTALANGRMAFPDGMVRKHDDFRVVATANTWGNGATSEYVGRNPIDAATIDRFTFHSVELDPRVEDAMLASIGLPSDVAAKWCDAVRKARANVQTSGLKILITPRATRDGARILANGGDMAEAFRVAVLKGAKPDQREKVLAGVVLA